ncbi:MAG TPA: tail fiber domain-containing protein [Puia sp.]|jgi:hypothetical protein|nr:tail fiber domain-containing protein [Puia sp.]
MKKISLFLIYGLLTFSISKAQSWLLTGNSISSGNFLGSTNNFNLLFKVGNVNSGLIDVTFNNTFLGISSGGSTISGTGNSAMGYHALMANTSGYGFVALGAYAATANTTAATNTALGMQSLYSNQVGGGNTAVGTNSLYTLNPINPGNGVENCAFGMNALFSSYNVFGANNCVFGSGAMYTSTQGYNCTLFGEEAGRGSGPSGIVTGAGFQTLHTITNSPSSGGGGNTALGFQSQFFNTSNGIDDISAGAQSLQSNQTSTDEIAIGHLALFNTIGGNNIGIGYSSLYNNTGSTTLLGNNVAIGTYTLYSNTTSAGNTAFGHGALYSNSNTTLPYAENTGVGYEALYYNTTGGNNTAMGEGSGPTIASLSGTVAIGTNAVPTQDNEAVFGSSVTTVNGGYVAWTPPSDGRFKKNITENIPGLEFITMLRPVTYTLDVHAINSFIYPAAKKGRNGEDVPNTAEDEIAVNQKEKIVYSGLIAQEVEVAAKKINYNFSGVDKPENSNGLYRLGYADFIPSLSKAVVQMSKTTDSLIMVANTMSLLLDKIQQQLDSLKLTTVQTGYLQEDSSEKLTATLYDNTSSAISNRSIKVDALNTKRK